MLFAMPPWTSLNVALGAINAELVMLLPLGNALLSRFRIRRRSLLTAASGTALVYVCVKESSVRTVR